MSGQGGFGDDEDIVYQSAQDRTQKGQPSSSSNSNSNIGSGAPAKKTVGNLKESLAKKYAPVVAAAVVKAALDGDGGDEEDGNEPSGPEMSEQTYQNIVSPNKILLLRVALKWVEFSWYVLLPIAFAVIWPSTLTHICLLELFSTPGYFISRRIMEKYAPPNMSAKFILGGLVTTNLCDLGTGFGVWLLATAAAREDKDVGLDFRGGLSLGVFFGLVLARLGSRIGTGMEEWGLEQLARMLPVGQQTGLAGRIQLGETLALCGASLLTGLLLTLHTSFGVIVSTVIAMMLPLARFLSIQGAMDGIAEQAQPQASSAESTANTAAARASSQSKSEGGGKLALLLLAYGLLLVTVLGLPPHSSPLVLTYLADGHMDPMLLGGLVTIYILIRALAGLNGANGVAIGFIPFNAEAFVARHPKVMSVAYALPAFAAALVFLLEPPNFNSVFAALILVAAPAHSALLRITTNQMDALGIQTHNYFASWVPIVRSFAPLFAVLLAVPFATPDDFAAPVWASCVISALAIILLLYLLRPSISQPKAAPSSGPSGAANTTR